MIWRSCEIYAFISTILNTIDDERLHIPSRKTCSEDCHIELILNVFDDMIFEQLDFQVEMMFASVDCGYEWKLFRMMKEEEESTPIESPPFKHF